MAKTPTQRELLIAGLTALGWSPDPRAVTRKYDVFKKSDSGENRYYVGRAGALRFGRTMTTSFSCSNRRRCEIMNAG